MTYNSQGKRRSLENLAGQVTTTAWEQFACIPVGELISAAKNAKSAKAACAFDDIGNRETSSERGTNSVYAANQLNQYTEISDSALSASPRETFTPQFDDDMRPSALREAVGIRSPIHFSRYYLRPLMEKGMIERTDPDSPKSPRQEYKLA